MLSHDRNSDNNEDEHMEVNENITNEKSYNLKAAQVLILSEISAYLSKSLSVLKLNDTICKVLCKNETFLPNADIMHIFLQKGKFKISSKRKFVPINMLQFWKDIIILLHKKKLLKALVFKLLNMLDEEYEIRQRKIFAALWINTIVYSFIQLDIAQSVCRTMEHCLNESGKQLSTKDLSHRVKIYVHGKYPYLQNVLWLDISSTIPDFLLDINFVSKLLLRANEFSVELIQTLLKFVTPRIDEDIKKYLLKLLQIFISEQYNNKNYNVDKKIYTVDDLRTHLVENKVPVHKGEYSKKKTCLLADQKVRNLQWKPALGMFANNLYSEKLCTNVITLNNYCKIFIFRYSSMG